MFNNLEALTRQLEGFTEDLRREQQEQERSSRRAERFPQQARCRPSVRPLSGSQKHRRVGSSRQLTCVNLSIKTAQGRDRTNSAWADPKWLFLIGTTRPPPGPARDRQVKVCLESQASGKDL